MNEIAGKQDAWGRLMNLLYKPFMALPRHFLRKISMSRQVFAFYCLIAVGIASSAIAQEGTGPRRVEVDNIFKDELVKQNIVGGAVAVVRDGHIIHSAGYGHTSLLRNTKISDSTVFRWASISKTLTAVAALQADESITDFEIEDRVSDHVDYWTSVGNKGEVTIKHALSNRSGIIHYSNSCSGNSNPEFYQSVHGNGTFDPESAVEVFKDQSLCFAPDTDYSYSTFGFNLVAAAIEQGSGQSYNDWVMSQIAAPLGMTSLRQATGTSQGFRVACGELKSSSEPSKSYVLAGGGWESNIVDLAIFANGILQE
ncbi:MAG: serine hydrolase domain-containing protein [Pseudomonadota bacterium]